MPNVSLPCAAGHGGAVGAVQRGVRGAGERGDADPHGVRAEEAGRQAEDRGAGAGGPGVGPGSGVARWCSLVVQALWWYMYGTGTGRMLGGERGYGQHRMNSHGMPVPHLDRARGMPQQRWRRNTTHASASPRPVPLPVVPVGLCPSLMQPQNPDPTCPLSPPATARRTMLPWPRPASAPRRSRAAPSRCRSWPSCCSPCCEARDVD